MMVSRFGSKIITRPKKDQPVPIVGEVFQSHKIKYDHEVDARLKELGWNVNEDSLVWWKRERALSHAHWPMYNVYRGPETVKEGIVDLFLLSKAEAILKSVGSYFRFAAIMIQCNKRVP